MIRPGRVILCLTLAAGLTVYADDQTASQPAGPPVQKEIAAMVAAYRAASGADVGVHALVLAGGTALCDIRSDETFIPASNQKILTSAVALKRLGRDFNFQTVVAVAGEDLVVIGDGDPTTGDPILAESAGQTIYAAFDRWAAELKAAGVKKVANLIVQCGIFQPPARHPDWPDSQRQNWYCAAVSGVNFNDNCFDIGFVISGKTVKPNISPLSRHIAVDCQVTTGRHDLWSVQFARSGAKLTLKGTVASSSIERLSVATDYPAMMFAYVLADRLERSGVPVAGNVLTSIDPLWNRPPPQQRRAITVESTPIAVVLQRANKRSLNMIAECLFLRSAVEEGKPATWQSACRTAQRVLAEDYGLNEKQFAVADGSGLSRRNRVAPAALTGLLVALAGEKAFLESLPVSGVDGSLRNKLAGPLCRGRVLGKTGYIDRVSSLSGYVLDRRGQPAAAFSIIVNGSTSGPSHSARALQESICESLVRFADSAAAAPASAPAAVKTPAK